MRLMRYGFVVGATTGSTTSEKRCVFVVYGHTPSVKQGKKKTSAAVRVQLYGVQNGYSAAIDRVVYLCLLALTATNKSIDQIYP